MSIRDLIPSRFTRKEVPVRRVEDPFKSFISEVHDLFDRFFSDFAVEPAGFRGEFLPKVDFVEEDKEYLLKAELPGLSEKDIDVSMDEDSITISGEKKEEKEESRRGYYYAERSFGRFHRVIPLPHDIDRDAVKATFKNGLLTVHLPKSKEALKETKKITVETE
ncbi:MAG: Hsp20/alpha crystallin family protein [Nitrospirae bacterium]|nr:MAG: Hsp20/alpha crystallin family protein [Nitrospirota bacterium]